MALAILLGGFFGLLVAGGVLAVGMLRHARREENEMNVAFAEARGIPHGRKAGPATWSSIDMESLREEGYDVDRSDPYATLTGEITWSESMLADGKAALADDDGDSLLIAEPVDAFAEPVEDVPEPVAHIAEPVTHIAEPVEHVAEPVTHIAEPVERIAEPITHIAEPVSHVADRVSRTAAPAPIRDDQPVVWRAPAQSQVIILAISLRALADAVAATVTQEAWERFDDAYAQVRARYSGDDGARPPSSIDVRAHERRSRNGPSVRRSAPPRRSSGPAPISWRPR